MSDRRLSLREMQGDHPQGWTVGEKCYGFAGGLFGRDSYSDKVCIATGFYAGESWAVFHSDDYYGDGLYFLSGSQLHAAEDYKTPEPDEDHA